MSKKPPRPPDADEEALLAELRRARIAQEVERLCREALTATVGDALDMPAEEDWTAAAASAYPG